MRTLMFMYIYGKIAIQKSRVCKAILIIHSFGCCLLSEIVHNTSENMRFQHYECGGAREAKIDFFGVEKVNLIEEHKIIRDFDSGNSE